MIAIFNSFPFHYEMFGCVLEFLTTRKLPFVVFSETRNEMGWFRVYESRFGSFPVKPIREYNPREHEYTLLLTDDDKKYKQWWSHSTKVIMFEHSGDRIYNRMTHRRIQLRQYRKRVPPSPADTWVLPVWDIGQRPKNPDILKVVAIGNNCPCNPSELIPWFYDITTIQFVFINRTAAPTRFDHASWSAYPNIHLLEDIDAEQMLEEAATADWLMLLPKNAYQYETFISAIHPISHGVCVPLLMKQEWCEAYAMGGIRPFDPSKPLTKPPESLLEELHNTRNELFERRDKILEESLSS